MPYTISKDEIFNSILDNDDEVIKIKIINFDDKYNIIKINKNKFYSKKENMK